MSNADKNPDLAHLSGWFSEVRMARYATAADPAALYAWDVRLQKAFLEDVEHVEVLLRNFIARRLAEDCLRRTGTDDPEAAEWIASVSRVADLRAERPKTTRDGVSPRFAK